MLLHDTKPCQVREETCHQKPDYRIHEDCAEWGLCILEVFSQKPNKVHRKDHKSRDNADPELHQGPLLKAFLVFLQLSHLAWLKELRNDNVLAWLLCKSKVLGHGAEPSLCKIEVPEQERALARVLTA